MYEDGHLYDFSEYNKNHPNFSLTNKKVYGIFKDDLNGKIITEFTADKPKMYTYEYINNYLDMLKKSESDQYKLIKSKMRSNEYIDNYTILKKKLVGREIKINTKALKYQLI